MHQHLVGPRVDEHGGVLVRVGNHQVEVQGEARDFANGCDHRRADGEVLNEVAIHHIEVQHGGAALFHLGDLLAQSREIRSQN